MGGRKLAGQEAASGGRMTESPWGRHFASPSAEIQPKVSQKIEDHGDVLRSVFSNTHWMRSRLLKHSP